MAHGIGVCNQYGKCEPLDYAQALNYSMLEPIDGKYTVAKKTIARGCIRMSKQNVMFLRRIF